MPTPNSNQSAARDAGLRLIEIVREDRGKFASDKRRKVNYTLASYRDGDGLEYRKGFTSYGEPIVPNIGTHATLNALKEQF